MSNLTINCRYHIGTLFPNGNGGKRIVITTYSGANMNTEKSNLKFLNDCEKNSPCIMDSVLDGAKEKVQEGADKIEKTIDKAGESINQVDKVAGNILARVSTSVGETLDTTAKKLEEGWNFGKRVFSDPTIEKATGEVSNIIKKYPIQALVGGFILGMWLARKPIKSK